MANNREFFCNHCGRETTFFLDSDMLWYCDECDHVLGSQPPVYNEDVDGDEWYEESDDPSFRCPVCNNLVNIHMLSDGYLCPVCFEDLSGELEKRGYEYDEDLEQYYRET